MAKRPTLDKLDLSHLGATCGYPKLALMALKRLLRTESDVDGGGGTS
jgi:hypothetical protein